MSCTKNPKKFLFFKFLGDHDEEIIHVGKFMRSSSYFKTRLRCKLCGSERTESFVSWDKLLEKGFTNEEIKKAENVIYEGGSV